MVILPNDHVYISGVIPKTNLLENYLPEMLTFSFSIGWATFGRFCLGRPFSLRDLLLRAVLFCLGRPFSLRDLLLRAVFLDIINDGVNLFYEFIKKLFVLVGAMFYVAELFLPQACQLRTF